MKKLAILSVLCLAAFPAMARNFSSTPGAAMAPIAYTTTDTAANVVTTYRAASGADTTHSVSALLLTVETNSVRLACGGGTPTQAGLGVLLVNGSSILLEGGDYVNGCSLISAANGSHGVVQFQPFWGN